MVRAAGADLRGACVCGAHGGKPVATLGLPELATQSLPEYEAKAIALATQPGALAAYQATLLRNRDGGPLFDTGRFCRNLEAAYATMHAIAERGEAPRAFEVERRP